MTRKRNVAADAEAALLEMAEDFRGTSLMSEDTYQEITMRNRRRAEAAEELVPDDTSPLPRR